MQIKIMQKIEKNIFFRQNILGDPPEGITSRLFLAEPYLKVIKDN